MPKVLHSVSPFVRCKQAPLAKAVDAEKFEHLDSEAKVMEASTKRFGRFMQTRAVTACCLDNVDLDLVTW